MGGPANHHPHGGYGGADSILLYLSHALATTVKVRSVAWAALAFLSLP